MTLVSGPASGSLVLNPDGSFVYTPELSFFGAESFTYLVDDGAGASDAATVTINVALAAIPEVDGGDPDPPPAEDPDPPPTEDPPPDTDPVDNGVPDDPTDPGNGGDGLTGPRPLDRTRPQPISGTEEPFVPARD